MSYSEVRTNLNISLFLSLISVTALFPAVFSDKPSKLLHVLDLRGLGQRMEKLFTKARKYLITRGRGQQCFNYQYLRPLAGCRLSQTTKCTE